MDQETITTETLGKNSGEDTNAGILTEADLASSFMERVDEEAVEDTKEIQNKLGPRETRKLLVKSNLPHSFDET